MLMQFLVWVPCFLLGWCIFFLFMVMTKIRAVSRLLERYDAVMQLYEWYKVLKGCNIGKVLMGTNVKLESTSKIYIIIFNSNEDLYSEIERIANDALKYYFKLNWLLGVGFISKGFDDVLEKLFTVLYDVRTVRYEMRRI